MNMQKCKITVLKTHFDEELAREYGPMELGPCPFHTVGQVFEADCGKPEGFCDEAWKAIHHYVFAVAHGVQTLFDGKWIVKEGVSINSCNDGIRPVVFKIERMDD